METPDYQMLIKTLAELDDLRKNLQIEVKKQTKTAEDRREKVEQQEIYYMGLLHDIGKIGISDAIINKTGKLTDEEFRMIKKHPEIGGEILTTISELPDISIGAVFHHEKYDGTGYPNKVAGEDIPLPARIIGIADAYDAMTSKRSYRDALPQQVVRSEIEKGRGTQFAEKCWTG